MTPRQAYNDQMHHAKARNIEWDLSYSEFLELWLTSGKWEERGRGNDKYCMCRIGDVGPYSIKNCFIATGLDNHLQRWDNKTKVTDTKAKEIRNAYLHTRLTQREIAEQFNVTQPYVSRIISGLRKAHA